MILTKVSKGFNQDDLAKAFCFFSVGIGLKPDAIDVFILFAEMKKWSL